MVSWHFDLHLHVLFHPLLHQSSSKSQSHERWWGPLLACPQDRLYLCPVAGLFGRELPVRTAQKKRWSGESGNYSQIIRWFRHQKWGVVIYIYFFRYVIVGIWRCTRLSPPNPQQNPCSLKVTSPLQVYILGIWQAIFSAPTQAVMLAPWPPALVEIRVGVGRGAPPGDIWYLDIFLGILSLTFMSHWIPWWACQCMCLFETAWEDLCLLKMGRRFSETGRRWKK